MCEEIAKLKTDGSRQRTEIAMLKSKNSKKRSEIARLTQALDAAIQANRVLVRDLQWMRGEKGERDD